MARLSRRTFLKGAAASGGTLAAMRFNPLAEVGDEAGAGISGVEDHVPTTCWIGKQDCGMVARRIDGRVINFDGHPDNPLNLGTLCPKGKAQITALYDPARVKTPLKRTNEKGVTGKWEQISWDEALDEVSGRIKAILKKNPELLLWQKGRSKSKPLYDVPFTEATGCMKLGHGAYCSDAGYRAIEYTLGPSGVLHPDFRYTKYVLSWGWNITGAGGNKFCWIVWPRQLLEAKKQGVKIVHIDPRLRPAGPFADEWMPIRPGTDMALALALSNALIKKGTIDKDYLTKYTNAPYLVKGDGEFLRVNGKEQVWDGGAKEAGKAANPALEGTYTVGGEKVKPALQLFKEHVAKYTPEKAAEICGVNPAQIKQIASDLAKHASIGKTITIDGKKVPHRPVSVMAYHMAQQELGMQTLRAMVQVFMLLGAVGAAGGVKTDLEWKIDDKYEELDAVEIGDPPYGPIVKESKYFAINSGNPSIFSQSVNDPKTYEVDPKKIPEMMLIHMANPIVAWPNTEVIKEAYKKIEYIAVIDPWMSETADYFADIVLPAATLEKYEGPMKASDQYASGKSLRLPVMKPLGEARGEIEIYLDIAERAGFLKGKGGYIDVVNAELELSGDEAAAGGKYALPLDRKPTAREIFNNWALAHEVPGGIKYFEKHGVKVGDPIPPEEAYGYATDPPFGGVVHRFYGESLQKYGKTMKEKGAPKPFWQDYTALPTWREPTMNGSPAEYDLYLISYKFIEYKQSRGAFLPMLDELAPEQKLVINPKTAKEKGIGDGDEVSVESHNAKTGEKRSLKTKAAYSEAIRPDVVGMPHHFGNWTYPAAKGRGPTPNTIIPTGEGYVANTADQSFHVKVRVSKA